MDRRIAVGIVLGLIVVAAYQAGMARGLAERGVGEPGQVAPRPELPPYLPHIFECFYKSKDSRGSGLGLAIARTLVELHGGEIEAESAPGQGTTIRIRLLVRAA